MAKSDVIQYKYREIPVDPTIVNNFSTENRMHYTPMRHSDELLDLLQELSEKVKYIINHKLTDRQREVVHKIYFEQLTQTEVAQELGLCQPTIHKIVKGNIDYQNGRKRYGGALKKIRKICDNDREVQSLLGKIEKLRAELLD